MMAAKDHPRVCGKNILSRWSLYVTTGSPPRVREELNAVPSAVGLGGITPACAGRTVGHSGFYRTSQDHPRVCGKNYPDACFICHFWGSPPRVREEL